jgi:hypothetical protein
MATSACITLGKLNCLRFVVSQSPGVSKPQNLTNFYIEGIIREQFQLLDQVAYNHDLGGRHVVEDKDDMWLNQLVTSVKFHLENKVCESHESGRHVAHILWVHVNLGDVNMQRHFEITTFGDVQLLLPTKMPKGLKVGVTKSCRPSI